MPLLPLSPADAPDRTRVVCEFPKGPREVVTAALGEFEGHPVGILRVRVPTASGARVWSRKGLTLRVDQLPFLEDAVRQLREAAQAGAMAQGATP